MYFEDTRTYQTNQNPIEELIQTLQERPASLVPFIGAGMSMPSGMPGWQGFLEGLILTSSCCTAPSGSAS